MNILVVGFGNMGCRHAQSLLKRKDEDKIIVIEPNKETVKSNKIRIGDLENRLIFIDTIEDLKLKIDFAIIATSSNPRFDIVLKLLSFGVKKFLIEKVVFQSEKQFKKVIQKLHEFKAEAYCNFVNRYFSNYQLIKSELSKDKPFKMIVSGGEFGLGCSSLHYMDLFEYMCNDYCKMVSSSLNLSNSKNSRGETYKEVNGLLLLKSSKGDKLLINSDIKKTGGVEITIIQDSKIHILNEESLNHLQILDDIILKKEDFIIKNTSELTNNLVNEIFENRTVLPTVKETMNSHLQIFKVFNEVFGLSKSELCPIT